MTSNRICPDCSILTLTKGQHRCDLCAAERRKAQARVKARAQHVPSSRIHLGRHGTAEEHFWVKVEKTADCWLWLGAKAAGYGLFRGHRAHRWAYENLRGPIPEDLTIDHLCRARACVNPAHMEAVTREENTRRAIA